MAKPKSNKIYKVTCVATGKSYTVRPAVWEARVNRFKTTDETLKANYLGREALKVIKGGGDPKVNLAVLCTAANREFPIFFDSDIWDIYINGKEPAVDEDIQEVIQVANTEVPCEVEAFEVIQAVN